MRRWYIFCERWLVEHINDRYCFTWRSWSTYDSNVNWFDALLQLQLTVVTASTVSFSGVPKNETSSKFLTHNSDFPVTLTVTLHCSLWHETWCTKFSYKCKLAMKYSKILITANDENVRKLYYISSFVGLFI